MSEKNKTIQDKLSALSETVAWFQSPSFELEAAVTQYRQAEALAKEIEHDLTQLKNEIQVVKQELDTSSS